MSYEREMAAARRAALAASARILDLYTPEVAVRWKGENDPVTAADEASTEVILDELGRSFPGEPVLIEERADDAARIGAERVWIVDPLDGTREFIDRIPEFCVMIGLVEGGEPVAGVVHVPLAGVAFAGAAGRAVKIGPDGEERPLRCTAARGVESMRLVVSRSHRSPLITHARELLGISAEVPSGSVGMKVARILLGEADLYIHLGPGIKLWDACSPDAILRAGGGRMTDAAGAAIDYTARSVAVGGLVASAGPLHDEVVGRIRCLV